MSASGLTRIEALNKDNFDTWKMQMETLLVKNNVWDFVNRSKLKPELVAGDNASAAAVTAWEIGDIKAKSDIILAINPSELKQVKGCESSREMWLKLEGIYQSRGPAWKATLLKQLILAILLLYSLPNSFENFRCAIESHDTLPTPEMLRIKIIEEGDARNNEVRSAIQDAMIAKGRWNGNRNGNRNGNVKKPEKSGSRDKEEFPYRCHRCKEIGHKAKNC